jgi:FkbM family methyltransferase
MISKVVKIAESVRYAGGLRALWGARPRSVTSWLIANRLKTVCPPFRTILDAGANVGQFARAANLCFPGARIISFEPLPDVAEKLAANLSDLPSHAIMRTALGSYDGETRFFRNSFDQSSSVLHMLDKAGGLLAGQRQVEELRIPIARLDTALAGDALAPPVLLKLDLQGNELAALEGAEQTLARCSHVLLETVFEPEYENEPVFEVLWEFLRERGFRFERPLNFVSNRRRAIVQMDALFVRASAATGLEPSALGVGSKLS